MNSYLHRLLLSPGAITDAPEYGTSRFRRSARPQAGRPKASLPWAGRSIAIAICLGMAACSSSDLRPDRELSEVEAAITEAESAGARLADPVLLNQAQMKLRLARDQVAKEQYEDAERTLAEAKVEAQLAKARAETQAAKRAAEEMETNINLLRQQINQSGTGPGASR